MRVLIAEDESYLAEAIRDGLQHEGIAADLVLDGESAVERLAVNAYDVLVLDRDLPSLHGDDVLRWIISNDVGARVLMVTAAAELEDKEVGFELGADDYLTKPFELRELVLRVRSLARRPRASTPPVLEFAGIRMDTFRRELHRDGRPIRLAKKQFAVLEVLLAAQGGVVSAEELLEKVWDENADPFTNAIRVTMSTLRKQLGTPSVIQTVQGVGYRVFDPGTVMEVSV